MKPDILPEGYYKILSYTYQQTYEEELALRALEKEYGKSREVLMLEAVRSLISAGKMFLKLKPKP